MVKESKKEDILDQLNDVSQEPIKRQKLYNLTYKKGIDRAKTGLIEASSEDSARDLGRKWCEQNEAKYIIVTDAVLVRELDTVK